MAKAKRAPLNLEALEDRWAPATYTWIGSTELGGTYWSNAENWSKQGGGTGVPGSTDTAIFDHNAVVNCVVGSDRTAQIKAESNFIKKIHINGNGTDLTAQDGSYWKSGQEIKLLGQNGDVPKLRIAGTFSAENGYFTDGTNQTTGAVEVLFGGHLKFIKNFVGSYALIDVATSGSLGFGTAVAEDDLTGNVSLAGSGIRVRAGGYLEFRNSDTGNGEKGGATWTQEVGVPDSYIENYGTMQIDVSPVQHTYSFATSEWLKEWLAVYNYGTYDHTSGAVRYAGGEELSDYDFSNLEPESGVALVKFSQGFNGYFCTNDGFYQYSTNLTDAKVENKADSNKYYSNMSFEGGTFLLEGYNNAYIYGELAMSGTSCALKVTGWYDLLDLYRLSKLRVLDDLFGAAGSVTLTSAAKIQLTGAAGPFDSTHSFLLHDGSLSGTFTDDIASASPVYAANVVSLYFGTI